MKNKLIQYKIDHPKDTVIKDKELLAELKKMSTELSWKESAALILLDMADQPKCDCGNKLEFVQKNKAYYKTEYGGWRQFCSRDCMYKSKDIVNKRRKTNFDRYGVESYAKTDEFKEISSAPWSDEKKQKFNKIAKQNALLKYGVDHYSKTDEYLIKRTATTQEKYGVDNVFQSPEKKQKIKESCIANNGYFGWFSSNAGKEYATVNNPMKDPEIKAKARLTWMLNNYSHVEPGFVAASRGGSPEEFKTYIDGLAKLGYTTRASMSKYVGISFSSFSAWMRKLGLRDQYIVKSGTSGIEIELYNFVKCLCPDTINGDRLVLAPKEIDIYVPSKKLGLEMDGIWSHSESEGKYPTYHVEKTDKCESQGIKLLHIFEDEWKDPIKQEIWKSIIRNKLGFITNKIYARKCKIVVLMPNDARIFLNLNHLSGFRPAKTHYGLIFNDELVSVMSIGNSIYETNTTEVIRFASKINSVVVGGLSKLLSQVSDKNLVCYADRRLSSTLDSAYMSFFNKIEITPPSWYGFDKYDYCRRHRLSFTKQKMMYILGDKYDNEASVYDNMLANEYDRIWDCGNIKMTAKITPNS